MRMREKENGDFSEIQLANNSDFWGHFSHWIRLKRVAPLEHHLNSEFQVVSVAAWHPRNYMQHYQNSA